MNITLFIFVLLHMSQFSTTLLITQLLSPPLIHFYFCNLSYLDFISSTCLPLLSLISFQISKSKSSPYFDQSSRGHPKENSKSLRNSRDKKKWRRRRTSEEHKHCKDHEEKWKAKQKRDLDTWKMHQIMKFVEKLS